MERHRLARYAPLAGLVWVAAFIAAFLIGGETPDDDSSTAKVVHYWSTHKGSQTASWIIASYGLLFFIWFASSLRSHMRLAEGGTGRLANISFAGAVVFTTGAFMALGFTAAVVDSVGDVPPQVTQSLFLVSDNIFLPFIVGTGLFLAPVGIVALRSDFLPSWAGWITLLIALVCITPVGFFGWIAGTLWVVPISIVLFRRGSREAQVPPPAPAAAV